MGYVIEIESLGGFKGKASEHCGRYVSRFDPDGRGGLGQLWTVEKPRDALQFESFTEAKKFWQQTSTVRPLRDDGKPNRPLTVFAVAIFDWDKQDNQAEVGSTPSYTENRAEVNFDDIFENAGVKEYLKRFKEKVLPNIAGSALVTTIVMDSNLDPRMCLEVGAAVLLDKPLIITALRGVKVSENLKRVAKEIVVFDDLRSPAAQKKLSDAINRVLEKRAN